MIKYGNALFIKLSVSRANSHYFRSQLFRIRGSCVVRYHGIRVHCVHSRSQDARKMAASGSSSGSPGSSGSGKLRLPMSRVKTIMKSSPYVNTIGQDALYLVTKATELFVHYLSEEAHQQGNKGHSLDYKHLAELVQTTDTLEFLREIIPRKITVRQFKEMMAAKNTSHSSSSESSSDSDSDSDSDTDSCSDSDKKKEVDNENFSGSEESKTLKANGKANSVSDKSEASKSDSETENKS